jgi:RNA polymerase sigma factor (sigma-70 family)
MLHHHPHYVAGEAAARRGDAMRRVVAADPGELERAVAAAAAGSEPAWHWLQQRFTARIRRVARSHRLGPEDVQDVTQTTWLRLFEHIGRLRDAQGVGAWLATTARRESLRVLASRSRDVLGDAAEHGLEPVAPTPAPDQHCHAAELQATVARACERLPERHRVLMHSLLAEDEPSYDEIAARLRMPRGSIGPIRGRCLARLRRDPALRALYEA